MGLSAFSARRVGLPFLAALVVLAAAALVLGSASLRTSAQTGTPAAAGGGFVGAWRLLTETPFGASQSLLTIMADGTVVFSDRPVLPGDAGFPTSFISAGHGAWEQTGPTTATGTWVEFVSDGEGNFLVTVTDSVAMTLGADGNSWSGPFSSTSADPGGNVLFVGTGSVEATRITVQPVATPAAATPAA
jgi:hypothetical protein